MLDTEKNFELKNRRALNNAIKGLEEISNTDFIVMNEWLNEEFRSLISRLKDNTLRVAVVGNFSSGKSTFLNALMGVDLLKHGTKETTATITEINNESMEGISFDAYYLDGRVEDNIDIELLEEYTSTSSETHQVANEIEKVVINCKMFDTNQEICFIDTPGLNGIADRHREITIEQAKRAHVCIYLIHVRGLDQSDLDFIQFLSRYQHSFIFVQNFIDRLQEAEGDSPEGKVEKQKEVLSEFFSNLDQEISYKVIGVSSKKALIAKDQNFKEYDGELLTDNLRQNLYKESRFGLVRSAILEMLENNNYNILQKKDSLDVALHLIDQLLEIANYRQKVENEKNANSTEAQKQEYYRQIIDNIKQHENENQKKLSNYIYSESDRIRIILKTFIEEKTEGINNELIVQMDGINAVNDFEIYSKFKVPSFMNNQISILEHDANENMRISFENMLRDALLRITEYTGVRAKSNNVGNLNLDNKIAEDHYKGYTDEDQRKIERLQKELAKAKADSHTDHQRLTELKDSLQRLNEKKNWLNAQENNIKNQRAKELENIGARPAPEIKTREKSTYKSHGGLGIMDFFFGKKEVTSYETYTDYTKQNEWGRKVANIENTYAMKLNNYRSQLSAVNIQIQSYKDDIDCLVNMEPQKKKAIKNIQDELESQKNWIEVQKELAKKEYLKELKKQLHLDVREYLGRICNSMIFNISVAIEKNRNRIEKVILETYKKAIFDQLKLYQNLIDENRTDTNAQYSQSVIKKIHQVKDMLNSALNLYCF